MRKKGLGKFFYKICHFRSGKLYKTCRRNWARLKGIPVVHFLHIRKTGGSAIKTALFPYVYRESCLIECHPHRITVQDVPIGEKIFFVVRDPIRRYLSGFTSRMNQGAPAHHVPWTPEEEAVFKQFSTPNQLALALGSKDPDLHKEARSAMDAISHVRSSYWDWFIDEPTLRRRASDVLIVLRQKQLNSDFVEAARLLGLPDSVKLSDDPITANRSPESADQHLDPAAEEALRLYYEKDYVFLGLCRELFRLKGDI